MNPYNLANYDFVLPPELLAHEPLPNRVDSRLLHLNQGRFEHRQFDCFGDLIPKNSLILLNDTRVMRARLHARKSTGARIEMLVFEPGKISKAFFKPARRVKQENMQIEGGPKIEILESLGGGVFTFCLPDGEDIFDLMQSSGSVPLPPYIQESLKDAERYQTVYANHMGSSAAPTAGLHFDLDLMQKLKSQGHEFYPLTLHVGPGTFKPVDVEDIRNFEIHQEWVFVPAVTLKAVRDARQNKRSIVAIGTTSLRAIESAFRAGALDQVEDYMGYTRLFLIPGAKIESIDFLLTNSHLPRSSLLMLLSSLIGSKQMKAMYKEAIEARYRFFSFGDACLVQNQSPLV